MATILEPNSSHVRTLGLLKWSFTYYNVIYTYNKIINLWFPFVTSAIVLLSLLPMNIYPKLLSVSLANRYTSNRVVSICVGCSHYSMSCPPTRLWESSSPPCSSSATASSAPLLPLCPPLPSHSTIICSNLSKTSAANKLVGVPWSPLPLPQDHCRKVSAASKLCVFYLFVCLFMGRRWWITLLFTSTMESSLRWIMPWMWFCSCWRSTARSFWDLSLL